MGVFWHQNWSMGILKFDYSDLYSFALHVNITVKQFFHRFQHGLPLFLSLITISSSASHQLQSLMEEVHRFGSLSTQLVADQYCWKFSPDSSSSVASCYKFQKSYPKIDSNYYSIWSLKSHPRMRLFIWQLAQNKVATIDNLKKRGWQLPNQCCLCKTKESAAHLFNKCNFFREVLHKAVSSIALLRSMNFSANTDFILDKHVPRPQRELMAILCFVIQRERCSRNFTGSCKPQMSSSLPQLSSGMT